jgi:hypothetical protein
MEKNIRVVAVLYEKSLKLRSCRLEWSEINRVEALFETKSCSTTGSVYFKAKKCYKLARKGSMSSPVPPQWMGSFFVFNVSLQRYHIFINPINS